MTGLHPTEKEILTYANSQEEVTATTTTAQSGIMGLDHRVA
jgi:hypothetical protein